MKCKLVKSLWKTVWKFLKNLKLELPYDKAIPRIETYSTERKISLVKRHHPPVTTAKKWKNIKVSSL